EERRELVDVDVPAEEGARPFEHEDLGAAVGRPVRRHDERGEQTHDGEPREQAAHSTPSDRRVDDEDEARRDRDDELRPDGREVGTRHRNASWNAGSVARWMTRSRLGSMMAIAGCGQTPRNTGRQRSGKAPAGPIDTD